MNSSKKGIAAALIGAIAAFGLMLAPAQAQDYTNVAFVQTVAGTTSIPVGHAEFCKARPAECRPNAQVIDSMPLSEALWQQLLQVNASWNAAVTPVTDEDLYQTAEFWTYPNGYGDCEDYVLAKRRDLINAGWPASTLLIAVVKQPNGEGHAVLLVRTDRGDLVLDNQVGSIDLWSNTPYKFIKRQSQADAGKWVDMIDNREVVVATAGIN
jgi:predicted transglutaminase-like cysteine proteinase